MMKKGKGDKAKDDDGWEDEEMEVDEEGVETVNQNVLEVEEPEHELDAGPMNTENHVEDEIT